MYTFKIGNRESGIDFESLEECKKAAQKKYEEICEDDTSIGNGEDVEEDAEIFIVTDDLEEIFLEKHTVTYEGYHGDYAEHNTNWGL